MQYNTSRVKDAARSLDDITDDGGPRWMLQMVVLSRDSDAYSDIRVIGQAIVSIEFKRPASRAALIRMQRNREMADAILMQNGAKKPSFAAQHYSFLELWIDNIFIILLFSLFIDILLPQKSFEGEKRIYILAGFLFNAISKRYIILFNYLYR